MKKAGLVSGEGKPKHAIEVDPPFVVDLRTANSKLVQPVDLSGIVIFVLPSGHFTHGNWAFI